MRGLCRLTAGLLTIAQAGAFFLPPNEATDTLRDAAQDSPDLSQAAQTAQDSPTRDSGALDFASLQGHSAQPYADEDGARDLIQEWLDTLDTPGGAIASTTSTQTRPPSTLVSVVQFASLAADQELMPEASSTQTSSTPSPSPTPIDWLPWSHGQQVPLGGIGGTWRAAKVKAQSVVALIASHITLCPSGTSTTTQIPAATSESSTLSARTVDFTPSASASAVTNAESSSRSSAVVDAQPSLATAVSEDIIHSLYFSNHASSTPYPTQATPGHYTPSTGAATATPTAPVIDTSYASSWDSSLNAGAKTQAKPVSSDAHASTPSADVRFILAIVISILVTLLFTSFTISFIIRRNPRMFQDSLARIEECKTQGLYKRAARKHRLETWKRSVASRAPFKWLWKKRTDDLAEKGLLEAAPGSANGGESVRASQEIQAFREAHAFVETLVRPEEAWPPSDRRRTYMWLFGGRARRQRAMSNASSDLSVCESEKSAPPAYDEHYNSEKIEPMVYTRMSREEAQDSDKSSVSSVIPTSPRHSTYTFSNRDPDSDNE